MDQYDGLWFPNPVRVVECEKLGAAIMVERGELPAPPAAKVGGKPKGLFAFTLTCSPKDSLSSEDLLSAVRRLMAQQTCPVRRYVWYLETKEGGLHPHIHGCYETMTEGVIFTKVFKRYWPIWNPSEKLGNGFRGGFHAPVDFPTAYLEYIEKDLGIHEQKGFLSP